MFRLTSFFYRGRTNQVVNKTHTPDSTMGKTGPSSLQRNSDDVKSTFRVNNNQKMLLFTLRRAYRTKFVGHSELLNTRLYFD